MSASRPYIGDPGEGRARGAIPLHGEACWIPVFAGMTDGGLLV